MDLTSLAKNWNVFWFSYFLKTKALSIRVSTCTPWKSWKVLNLTKIILAWPGKFLKISASSWKSWNFFPVALVIREHHFGYWSSITVVVFKKAKAVPFSKGRGFSGYPKGRNVARESGATNYLYRISSFPRSLKTSKRNKTYIVLNFRTQMKSVERKVFKERGNDIW